MKRTNTKWWAAKSSESEVCGHTSAFVALPPLRIMTRFGVHCSFLLCTNCASLWNFEVGVTENRIIVKPRRVRYICRSFINLLLEVGGWSRDVATKFASPLCFLPLMRARVKKSYCSVYFAFKRDNKTYHPNAWKLEEFESFLQRLRVIWRQCCLRVKAGPCLPYFNRNPLYGYTIFTHIRRDTWKTSHFGLQHLGVPCHTAWWKPGTILKETSLDSERSSHVGGCLTGARDVR